MSRKFTDSEIRAYSKNRYEEKVLRGKLDKLKEDMGVLHDSTAKRRQNLVEECREIRMTTGGSPVPRHCNTDTEFDLSSRIQRPWAYSVMETTYNVAYKDAVIPIPKTRRRRRPDSSHASSAFPTPRSSTVLSSRSARSMTELHSESAHCIASFKSCASSKRSHIINLSDSAITGCAVGQQGHKAQSPVFVKVEKETNVESDTIERAPGQEELDCGKGDSDAVKVITVKVPSVTPDICVETHSEPKGHDTVDGNEHMEAMDATINPNNLFLKPIRPESRIFTAPLALPSAYQINSKDYQEAQRRRTINRSRSRVSFSSPVNATTDQSTKDKPSTPERVFRASMQTVNAPLEPEATSEKMNNGSPEDHRPQKSHLLTLDPETMQDINVRNLGDVTYKGKLLRNYIRPEERYKIDPIIIKRRQNKMDKLAKESVSFLKKVNHENIKVDIAFPRSARKRILTKLVAENNSGKGKKVAGNDGAMIKQKIEYFMASISDYIRKQQLERELTV